MNSTPASAPRGLHTVRRKVEFIERPSILPPELFARYENDAFWMDPALSVHGVRTLADAPAPSHNIQVLRTNKPHQPDGLIGPATTLQALGACQFAHSSQRASPLGVG